MNITGARFYGQKYSVPSFRGNEKIVSEKTTSDQEDVKRIEDITKMLKSDKFEIIASSKLIYPNPYVYGHDPCTGDSYVLKSTDGNKFVHCDGYYYNDWDKYHDFTVSDTEEIKTENGTEKIKSSFKIFGRKMNPSVLNATKTFVNEAEKIFKSKSTEEQRVLTAAHIQNYPRYWNIYS